MDEARRIQLECFRRMSPGERLSAAHRLYWTARGLKAAYLRTQHPEWSEGEVQAAAKQAFLHART